MTKQDIRKVNSIAKEYKMTDKQRQSFGKFLEEEKKELLRGSQNEKGDFTYQELYEKAKEFLGIL